MVRILLPLGLFFGCSAVLALAAEHKYPKGLDRKVLEEPPEGCKETVSKHDMVHIVHKGYALNADGSDGELMDANPPKPGTKDVPEPLVISIGKGQVLRGMEQGLIGTCLDQTIELIMAPELAFDDKSKVYKDKPVAEGTSVKYQIKVVRIEKGAAKRKRKAKKSKQTDWYGNAKSVLVVVALALGAYALKTSMGKGSGKGGKRGPKRGKRN